MFVWMPANCDLSFCFRQAATLAKLGFCISVTGHAHSLRGRTYLFLGGERTTHPRDFIFWGARGPPMP